MTRSTPLALISAALVAATGLGACASDRAAREPAYVVVEENASISSRHLVRRISVLDDDLLLIEEGAGRYYQVQLTPACVDFADVMTPVRLEETGAGIDRSSRFVVGGRRCFVRRIDRVERNAPGAEAIAAAEESAEEAEEAAESAAVQ